MSTRTDTRTLDQLASLARTALDDPDGLPEGEGPSCEPLEGEGRLQYMSRIAREGRAYAIDNLDEIIETLNPGYEIGANYARTLRAVGLVLAERMDEMASITTSGQQEPGATRPYDEAATAIDAALDLLDVAIRALEEEEQEPEEEWQPQFSPWRHGGWYVDNIRYPSGAVGCVSRNYADRKWRIVCDERDDPPTFKNRDEAARAERILARGEGGA